MITLIFNYFKTGALLFLLNDYFKRNYPYEYEMFYITTTYKLINIYSRCQILCKNSIHYITYNYPDLINFIQNFFNKNNHNKNNHNKNDLQFIKDSNIIKLGKKNEYVTMKLINITDCDFILYSDYKQNNNISIKIINNINLLDKTETYQYELTDYKFLLVEFIINGKNYKINLSTDKYNFYVLDNILDEKFFLYYLKYYLPDRQNENYENPKMFVKIIDHNVNSHLIDLERQYIQLGKTEYMIIDKN